mgnify:FL=1
MQLIKFKILGDVVHGFSERGTDFSRENYDALGIEKLAIAKQTHSDHILSVEKAGIYQDTDAFVTNVPGLALTVRCADCQAVLLHDPVAGVVAAVHSGWRGNAQNIIGKTVRKMVEEYRCDPANIRAAIGPSLGTCCAEFSDPHEELPEFMHKYVDGKHVNLWQCAEDQLSEEGVKQIENSRICTA